MLEETIRAARHFVLGESGAVGPRSMTSAHLVKQALRAMMMTRLKVAGAAAMFVGVLTCVATGVAAMVTVPPDRPDSASARGEFGGFSFGLAGVPAEGEELRKAAESDGETVTFRGRVSWPDGKPAAGAAIYALIPGPGETVRTEMKTKTDEDGRFRFTLARSEVDSALESSPFATITVLATAGGVGPDWADISKAFDQEMALRFVEDSVPISGRILDLQGKPVAGARITRGLDQGRRSRGNRSVSQAGPRSTRCRLPITILQRTTGPACPARRRTSPPTRAADSA